MVKPVTTEPFAITAPMVRPLAVLFWMISRSLLAVVASLLRIPPVPPVIVSRLFPTFDVTRMPPVFSVLVPRLTVAAPVPSLNRMLVEVAAAVTVAVVAAAISRLPESAQRNEFSGVIETAERGPANDQCVRRQILRRPIRSTYGRICDAGVIDQGAAGAGCPS